MAYKLAKILGMGAVLLVVFAVGQVNAKVTGQCANCHTMHNSQDGAAMRDLTDASVIGSSGSECLDCHGEQRSNLMILSCLGCHAQNLNGPNLVTGAGGSGDTPQVYYATTQADLAAGNFGHIDINDPFGGTYGHNVHGFDPAVGPPVIGEDFRIAPLNTPPGYFASYDPSTIGYDPNYPAVGKKQIQCAGANGCHGNRNELGMAAAMAGSHHADDTVLKFGSINQTAQGATVGTSYRFLYRIKGGEDDDWQATSGAADHNEYFGKTYAGRSSQAYAAGANQVQTMSNFCAECHGDFHAAGAGSAGDGTAGIGTGASPWIRHPNDIALPSGSPWTGYSIYSLEVPIARTAIPDPASSTVTAGAGDIVMCLSCHKAHSSQYQDILRFSYSLMETGTIGAGQGTGCFVCHTLKDG